MGLLHYVLCLYNTLSVYQSASCVYIYTVKPLYDNNQVVWLEKCLIKRWLDCGLLHSIL